MKRMIVILLVLAILVPAVLTPGMAQAAGAEVEFCKIEVGASHILALKNDGTVWAWGQNDYGQIGCGSTAPYITSPTQVSGLTNITDISTRGDYCLALDSDGAVWSWGRNDHGQLGIGNYTDQYVPQKITSIEDRIVDIYAGWLHSMAINDVCYIYAWGQNESGQLGTGSTSGRQKTPVMIDTISFVDSIAIGYRHTLFLKEGEVYVAGNNTYGQLGLTSNPDSTGTVTKISSLTGATAIDCGKDFSAAIANGSVYTWGRNTYGQLGDNTRANSNIPVNTNFANADSIECGENFVLARTTVDEATAWYGWGNNVYGQLGNGTGTYKVWNEKQTALTGWTSTNVSAGSHCVAMWENGKVYMCGMNQNSEMNERQLTYTAPTYLADVWDAYPIYGDENETYIFNGFDEFFAFGANERRYDCDDYAAGEGAAFRQIEDVRKLMRDDANEIEVKLTVDGKVYTRGDTNKYGQLGVAEAEIVFYPEWNYVMDGVQDIATIDGAVFVVKTDGTALVWGNTSSSQVTKYTLTDSNHWAMKQLDIPTVSEVEIVDDTVYFHPDSSGVETKGYVAYYPEDRTHTPQLQTSLITYTAESGYQCEKFPALSTFENVADISANGGGHALILRTDGTVWTIGDNTYGQLGNGTYTDSDVPVQVQGITNAVAVYAGPTHSVVCTADYKVYVWGNNAQAQLGFAEENLYYSIPTRVYYRVPVELSGNWTAEETIYLQTAFGKVTDFDQTEPYELYYNADNFSLTDACVQYPETVLMPGVYDHVEIVSVESGKIRFKFRILPTHDGAYVGTGNMFKFLTLHDNTAKFTLYTYR